MTLESTEAYNLRIHQEGSLLERCEELTKLDDDELEVRMANVSSSK